LTVSYSAILKIEQDHCQERGRRSFDTTIEYNTAAMVGAEKTRTAKPHSTLLRALSESRRAAVRATCSILAIGLARVYRRRSN
jgi:hypothetical protein